MLSNKKKDLLNISDLSPDDIKQIFKLTTGFKKRPFSNILKNNIIGMIFTKSSTRTRVSFEVGIAQLGGKSLFLSPNEIQLGRGETIEDTAKVLSRYLNGVIIRTYAHKDIETFANNASIPVINGLTDLAHPCQVLTDIFTIEEKLDSYKNKKVVFLGDCKNNMAYTLLLGAAILGFNLTLSGHKNYMPTNTMINETKSYIKKSKAKIEIIPDPLTAVKDADVIYTDVWTSMGQETESKKRKKDLLPWQINSRLMKSAGKKSIFMHCLPAHQGEEVTSDVLKSPQSVVFDQAENRLHVQKAILTHLMK